MRSCLFLMLAFACLTAKAAVADDAGGSPNGPALVIARPLPTSASAVGESRPSQPTPPLGTGSSTSAQPSSSDTSGLTLQQPAGFKVGTFTLFPNITAGGYFDSNVFADPRGSRVSDWAFLVRPELALRLDGSEHSFLASAFVEQRKYISFGSEDQLNAGVSMAGTVQIDADTQFQSRFGFLRGHEDRGTGESAFFETDHPLSFNQYEVASALNKRWDRWWTSVGGGVLFINYDTPTVLGVPLSENYRDGRIASVNARLGYVVAPLTSIFVEWAGNRRDFEVSEFGSKGYRIDAGLLFEPGPGSRVKGEAYAGYMHQDYVGPTFLDISTYTYGGALSFLLTPELVATVEGRREAKESALDVGVSLIESSIGGRLDYQILPNVTVGGGATYLRDNFRGARRTDDFVSPFASVKYLINKSLTLGFDYRRLNYNPGDEFAKGFIRDVYLVSLNARF